VWFPVKMLLESYERHIASFLNCVSQVRFLPGALWLMSILRFTYLGTADAWRKRFTFNTAAETLICDGRLEERLQSSGLAQLPKTTADD
jgi:hypothetical protein